MPLNASCEPEAIDDLRRCPSVAGTRNFRDLGGNRTVDGRQVRWGQIYRSGSLAGIAAEGREALTLLGLRGICDLRTSRERQAEPYDWCGDLGLSYWCRDYETSFGELRRLLEADMTSGEQARAAMMAGYRRLPFEQAPAYRELFRQLAASEVPLVFCCSAGKDRAGTAAALVLTALGVPRASVVQDYVLTDRVVDLERSIVRNAHGRSSLSRHPPEVVRAILGCDIAYIDAALDAVASSPAVFIHYLNDTLGIDATGLEAIRARLLE